MFHKFAIVRGCMPSIHSSAAWHNFKKINDIEFATYKIYGKNINVKENRQVGYCNTCNFGMISKRERRESAAAMVKIEGNIFFCGLLS